MVSCSSVSSVPAPLPPDSFEPLWECYRRHVVDVRQVCSATVCKHLAYLRRFVASTGPHRCPSELFRRLDRPLLVGFLATYADSHGVGARRWMHGSLRGFLRFCCECGYVGEDLSALVPAVRPERTGCLPRCLPDDCIARLGSETECDTVAGRRDAAIISLLATYGVRGVQIRRLGLDQIDWPRERIHFPAAKGGRPVHQHLTAEVGNRLSAYLLDGRPSSPCPEVFLTLTEPLRPLSAPCLSWIVRRHIDRLGMTLPEGVSRGTHGFRHAFATRMTGRIPFKDLSDLLGHRDPDSTLIYGKVDADALRQASLPWPGGER